MVAQPVRHSNSWPLPTRIRGVLRQPRATFEALAAAPRSADVLALAFVATCAAAALVLETETGELALLDHLERTISAVGGRMDEAKYATLQEMSGHGALYALATALVRGPLLAVGLSAALVGVLRAPAGAPVSYRQVLAVTAHAGVVLALGQAAAAPLIYARETMTSPLTLALFFTILDQGSPLARFAAMIDLFVIWWLVVLAIGVSVLYRRQAARLVAAFAGLYVVMAALVALTVGIMGGTA